MQKNKSYQIHNFIVEILQVVKVVNDYWQSPFYLEL
jgi:hypothetical protein